MHVMNYTLAILLDIVGAFNNVHPDAIVRDLGSLNLGKNLIRFIELLLKSRIIMARRGTPQDGVLSPLLRNLAVNSLLRDWS